MRVVQSEEPFGCSLVSVFLGAPLPSAETARTRSRQNKLIVFPGRETNSKNDQWRVAEKPLASEQISNVRCPLLRPKRIALTPVAFVVRCSCRRVNDSGTRLPVSGVGSLVCKLLV